MADVETSPQIYRVKCKHRILLNTVFVFYFWFFPHPFLTNSLSPGLKGPHLCRIGILCEMKQMHIKMLQSHRKLVWGYLIDLYPVFLSFGMDGISQKITEMLQCRKYLLILLLLKKKRIWKGMLRVEKGCNLSAMWGCRLLRSAQCWGDSLNLLLTPNAPQMRGATITSTTQDAAGSGTELAHWGGSVQRKAAKATEVRPQ